MPNEYNGSQGSRKSPRLTNHCVAFNKSLVVSMLLFSHNMEEGPWALCACKSGRGRGYSHQASPASTISAPSTRGPPSHIRVLHALCQHYQQMLQIPPTSSHSCCSKWRNQLLGPLSTSLLWLNLTHSSRFTWDQHHQEWRILWILWMKNSVYWQQSLHDILVEHLPLCTDYLGP